MNIELAKEKYARIGVSVDDAIKKLKEIPVSMHCWQGDDIDGFEGDSVLSGGIAVTGNYPGKARGAKELMADIDKALSLIPGKKRINLHAIYAITDKKVDRDELLPEHFAAWVEFAKERGLGIDFNPTFFSHEKAANSLTLSSPDEEIRKFWVRHGIASRKIAKYIGKELGTPCLCNIWIPDGYKEIPADRLGPRMRLKASLDEILADKTDNEWIVDAVESKVFGMGLEAYTVGSHEFYMGYAAKNNICCLLDNGHFHPTEMCSDKIPALLTVFDKVPLHVTRPMRWDSDHVVLFDDELREMAKEIVRCDATDRVLIGLDYFDASLNRIAAWAIGMRNMQKALLYALLTPNKELKEYQDKGDVTSLMAISEEIKTMPFGEVWDYYCEECGVPVGADWLTEAKKYEDEVLSKR